MDLGLAGKSALVSGSSRGIGRAIALALAGEGCRVVLTARGPDALDAAVAEARARGGQAIGVAADLTTVEGVDQVVRATTDAFGGADILVNNVGGSGARTFEEADEADLR